MSMEISEFRAMNAALESLSNKEMKDIHFTTDGDTRTTLFATSKEGAQSVEDNIYLRSRLLSAVRDCLMETGADGSLKFATPKAEAFFKETETKLFGKTDGNGRFGTATASTGLSAATLKEVLAGLDATLKTIPPAVITIESRPSDETELPFTGTSLPTYVNNGDEVDPNRSNPAYDTDKLVQEFDAMIAEYGKHARELGGAPHFDQKMPRQPLLSETNSSAFGITETTKNDWFDKQAGKGGLLGMLAKVGASLTGAEIGRTPFERGALLLDGFRRLAKNINHVLAEFPKRSTIDAINYASHVMSFQSHVKDGSGYFTKGMIVSQLNEALELVRTAFKVAAAKGNFAEFGELCSGTACFQDVVKQFTEYLDEHAALKLTPEQLQKRLDIISGKDKTEILAAQARQNAAEAERAKGKVVADPNVLAAGYRSMEFNNAPIADLINVEIQALYAAYPIKNGHPTRIFTKDELFDYLKNRFEQLDAERKTSPEGGLCFGESDEETQVPTTVKYEDTPAFWKKVEDLLIANDTIKNDDEIEYSIGYKTKAGPNMVKVVKKNPDTNVEETVEQRYVAFLHGSPDKLKPGVSVSNWRYNTDSTRPNQDAPDFQYKKGDVRIPRN